MAPSRLEQLAGGGEKAFSGGGEPYAVAVPEQKGKAHLFFQAVHHVGQTRLGQAQPVGGPREAAQLYRRQHGLPFFGLHLPASLSGNLPLL